MHGHRRYDRIADNPRAVAVTARRDVEPSNATAERSARSPGSRRCRRRLSRGGASGVRPERAASRSIRVPTPAQRNPPRQARRRRRVIRPKVQKAYGQAIQEHPADQSQRREARGVAGAFVTCCSVHPGCLGDGVTPSTKPYPIQGDEVMDAMPRPHPRAAGGLVCPTEASRSSCCWVAIRKRLR